MLKSTGKGIHANTYKNYDFIYLLIFKTSITLILEHSVHTSIWHYYVVTEQLLLFFSHEKQLFAPWSAYTALELYFQKVIIMWHFL